MPKRKTKTTRNPQRLTRNANPTALRLNTYSKPILVELVLELRDRFAHTAELTRQKDQHITLLLKRLTAAQANLRHARKKLRAQAST